MPGSAETADGDAATCSDWYETQPVSVAQTSSAQALALVAIVQQQPRDEVGGNGDLREEQARHNRANPDE